jgi:hypothetical protein
MKRMRFFVLVTALLALVFSGCENPAGGGGDGVDGAGWGDTGSIDLFAGTSWNGDDGAIVFDAALGWEIAGKWQGTYSLNDVSTAKLTVTHEWQGTYNLNGDSTAALIVTQNSAVMSWQPAQGGGETMTAIISENGSLTIVVSNDKTLYFTKNESGPVIIVGETIGPLSLYDLFPELEGLPANTATKPHLVKLDSSVVIDTGDSSANGVWATINRTVGNSGKYVILDLSACSAKGNQIEGGTILYGCMMNIIENNQFIKGITLPSGLTEIGNRAFYFCKHLSLITIQANVTRISTNAFSGCDGLTSVTVPAAIAGDFNHAYHIAYGVSARLNVVLTGPGAVANDAFVYFNGRKELVSVTIGQGVTGVSAGVFDNCPNLTAVYVDAANTDYSSVDGVLFSKDKTVLYYCPRARSVAYSIPHGVKGIAHKAFAECTGLTGITLPAGLEIIGVDAFYNCASAFTGELTLPSSLTNIYPGAFYNCNRITRLIIPESVTNLGGYRFSSSSSGIIITLSWNYGAFDNCSGLTSVTIPVGLTTQFSTKFTGYSSLELTLTGTGSIPDRAFASTDREIDSKNYDCAKITRVTIGNGITGIGQYAFSGCSGLTSIDIVNGITSIGQYAFSNCANLEKITVAPGNSTYSSVDGILYNKAQSQMYLVPQKLSGSVNIPSGITSIGERAFSNRTKLTHINVASANSKYSSLNGVLFDKEKKLLIQYPAGRTDSYTIPSTVETIGEYAFEGCAKLTSVTIPNSYTEMPVTEWLIGTKLIDGVSTIRNYAFSGCTSLTKVIFGGPGIVDHRDYENDLAGELIGFFSEGGPDIHSLIKLVVNAFCGSYSRGFYNNAFPQDDFGAGGDALKNKYLAYGVKVRAGTYTRTAGGSTWTKQ